MQKFYDCGIDLGTTNSCLAIPDDNHGFEIIENQADRMQVTPSAVMINGKGRMLVGQRAYNSQKVEDLAIQFKRSMGTDKLISFKSAGLEKSPEELSAEILKALRSDAETRLNRQIKNVIITVPAAFKTLQSEATNKAGRLAGFENIVLLQEPIAAAVAYGAEPDSEDKYWMVFDYGGGTLDVAIVSTMNKRLTVKNSEGDNYFGGSDIDRLMYREIILRELKASGYKVDELLDEGTGSGRSLVRRIQLDCENCKVELSTKNTAVFELFDVDDDEGEPIEFEYELRREELEELIAPIIDKSIEIAGKALNGAGITADRLDKILLVGGSTFIPLLRQRLKEEFGVELDSSLNPMTVVAAGAAIYASQSVIDVEEETESEEAGHAVVNLTYEPISSEEMVNVIGKVSNIGDVNISRIKVDCATSEDFSGIEWTSGWVEMLDAETGIFDVDVLLQKFRLNHYRLSACDNDGREIIVENPFFEIRHRENVLKTAAPPATMSIGVQIQDPETGYDILHHIVRKNTSLPASGTQSFKLTRDFKCSSDDCIRISIWEGENISNPKANHPAGEITVQASAMDRNIPRGTNVELTITEDRDRMIHVSGYIPDFDYEIPEETLRSEARINLGERMDDLDTRIMESGQKLNRLENKGTDISDLRSRLNSIKSSFREEYGKIETDEKSVNNYIDSYNELESNIIEEERKYQENEEDNKIAEKLELARNRIRKLGSSNDRYEMDRLEADYRQAHTRDEKASVAQRMSNLGYKLVSNDFDWLRNWLDYYDTHYVCFTNEQKAEYWKKRGYEAAAKRDTSGLKDAVQRLWDLEASADDGKEGRPRGADLTI